MKKRLFYILLAAGLASIAILTALTQGASAELRTITVQLATGQVITVTVDVPPDTPLNQIQLPGTPVAPGTPSTPTTTQPSQPSSPSGGNGSSSSGPTTKKGAKQKSSGSDQAATPEEQALSGQPQAEVKKEKAKKKSRPSTPLRNPDGTPSSSNPTGFDALPGPSYTRGVPNFVIEKFRVPIFLLPIYQAAGIQYGIRWEVLAAINEIETDYGRNLNVSSAGAVGWMQFIPSSWRAYGVDANKDGKKDPYNPVDAIFAAARYLKAADGDKDIKKAIFAYNHAGWYVDSVMMRAKLISGVPGDLVGSLTGLTEGRFPVYAKARYADDLQEAEATRRVKNGQNAANVVESNGSRKGIDIFAAQGSPVVAVNDGVVKKIGSSKALGKFIVLQDTYGNQFTYSGLQSVSQTYPVPKDTQVADASKAKALPARDAKPKKPASAGNQRPPSAGAADGESKGAASKGRAAKGGPAAQPARASVAIKERLFANPSRPNSKRAGGLDQLLAAKSGKGFSTFRNYFSRPLGLDPRNFRLKQLRKGAQVIGGTLLGKVGRPVARGGSGRSPRATGKASHLFFQIQPAGKGAPYIDPKPILDGWKLLEATAIYRASGKNALYDSSDKFTIGQVLLLPKPLLEKRVLSDPRISIYPCGRNDIKTGQIDRRVLAVMEYLAESGMKPSISSLKCGHSFYTSAGGVSEHSSGNAVDVWAINGTPILGHQDRGGITEIAVRRLMRLQGTMRPHQIISLLDLGANTLALSDHNDHIHIGFYPMFGDNKKLGKQALAVLKPGQWDNLLKRLRQIDNPVVPTKTSKYALPAGKSKPASKAHQGE